MPRAAVDQPLTGCLDPSGLIPTFDTLTMNPKLRSWFQDTPGTMSAVSGLVGGLAMAMYEMSAMWAQGTGLLRPLDMISSALPEPQIDVAKLGAGATLIGLLLHLGTAAFWATRYGHALVILRIAPRWLQGWLGAWLIGPLWGVIVWLLMGLIIGPALNPAMRQAAPLHYFVAHVIYGTVTALFLHQWMRRLPPSTSPP